MNGKQNETIRKTLKSYKGKPLHEVVDELVNLFEEELEFLGKTGDRFTPDEARVGKRRFLKVGTAFIAENKIKIFVN